MEFASYISGFADGEGSFSISFSKRSKLKTHLEVRPSFSISQHKRSLNVLKDIKNYFGVGSIRFSKRDQNYKFEVRAINDLVSKIIPHFEIHPLKTKKNEDFGHFKEVCQMVDANLHLNKKYLAEIINLAYKMNESGKRKYTKDKLLKLIAR